MSPRGPSRAFLAGALIAASVLELVFFVQRDDARQQRDDARAQRDTAQADLARLADLCTFRVDGSAICPPDTFDINPAMRSHPR